MNLLRHYRVLVADDDLAVRTLMSATLERAGFEVSLASDGHEAVLRFLADAPDLVLLDVEMPGLDGFAACTEIRGMDPGHTVPVVMITGHDDTGSIDRCFEVGATDFVAKPINWALIGHRLRYVLLAAENVRSLQNAENENRALLDALPDAIYVVRRDGSTVQRIGEGLPSAVGGRAPDTIDSFLPSDVAKDVRSVLADRNGPTEPHTFEYQGGDQYFELRLVPRDRDRILLLQRDITERKRAEERIHRLAFYDTLTSLPNREHFLQRLESSLTAAQHGGWPVAVLYVDIDRFKRFNDTLGHAIGDDLLRLIASRLVASIEALRRTAPFDSARIELARLTGDEFGLLAPVDEADALILAQRLQRSFEAPLRIAEREFFITPSIGIAIHPRDGRDVVSVLKNADTAMFDAKADGRSRYKVYAPTMSSRGVEQLQLEDALRRAIESDELAVHYQPQHRVNDLVIVGAEALLRWYSPKHGNVSPAKIIPLAEETGLINEIDLWVAITVARTQKRWRANGLALPVAINLSASSFAAANLYNLVRALDQHGVQPHQVELEITESVLMRDIDETKRALAALRDLGFRVSLDDFGTAYSSLNYLKELPVNTIKIDRSFIRNVATSPQDASICTTIIDMAHQLGCTVIAEGVETEAQLDFLRSRGCDVLQGFLISRPVPAADFESLASQSTAGFPPRAAPLAAPSTERAAGGEFPTAQRTRSSAGRGLLKR